MKLMIKMFTVGFLLSLISCSSQKYEKLRTVDEVVSNYDTANYKTDGMFITKRGAVVDVKIEEVQSQKKRLEVQLYEAEQKIQYLQESNQWLERDNVQMRIRLGLSAEKPKASGKCCTKDGFLIPGTVKEAPTLDQELAKKAE